MEFEDEFNFEEVTQKLSEAAKLEEPKQQSRDLESLPKEVSIAMG
ncbi:hypothetical protein [Pseudoalteromonas phenolica]|nr:hypothetical protein [Pseudoalteromonas phenolica]